MDPERVGYAIGSVLPFVVIGLILLAVYRSATWEKRFLRALDGGDRAKARKLLDRNAKPRRKPRNMPGSKQKLQRSRLMGLWLLGEEAELRAELARPGGSPSYVANVQMFGVLALATAPGDHAGLPEELDAMAAGVRRDSTRLLPSVPELAELLARVGGALGGRPVSDADAQAFHVRSFSEPLLSRVLMLRILVIAADRAGKPGLRLQRMLATLTSQFTPAPA